MKTAVANQNNTGIASTPKARQPMRSITVNLLFFHRKNEAERAGLAAELVKKGIDEFSKGNDMREFGDKRLAVTCYFCAADFFSKAIRKDRNSADARVWRARAYSELLELEKGDPNTYAYVSHAIDNCKKAFELDPKNAAMPAVLAKVLFEAKVQEIALPILALKSLRASMEKAGVQIPRYEVEHIGF